MYNRVSAKQHSYFTPFNLLMMFLWSYGSIIYFVNLALNRISSAGKYVSTVVLVVLILASMKEIKKRIKLNDVFFYLAIVVLFFAQYLLYPQNGEILNQYASSFLLTVVPFFFFGLLIDIHEHKELFYWVSLAAVIVQSLYQLWYRPMTGEYISSEDMVAAYQIAPHVCFLFWVAFDRKRMIYYVPAVLAFIFQVSLGNRGSLVCVVLFVVYCLFFVLPSKKGFVSRVFAPALAVVILANYNRLSDYLTTFFMGHGMSVRVFTKLSDNEFTFSESRQWITNALFDAVDNGPLFGYGLAGDRGVSGILYAHNFVVEIFVAFGYVLGGLILAALAIYVIKAFIRAKDTEDRTFLVLLICCFMKLMLSGTYMEDYDIWILLGYCAGLLRRTRSVGDNVNMQSTAIGKNTRLEVVK